MTDIQTVGISDRPEDRAETDGKFEAEVKSDETPQTYAEAVTKA